MSLENTIRAAFEAPARALEEGVEIVEHVEEEVINKEPFRAAEEYVHTLGPGLTTGAADDDPSGIATYSQTGAQYGFQLLWLSLFTFPLMAMVQEMCARIGLVTNKGLAANIRTHYPLWLLYTCTGLLFIVNTFNLGADLGAMAKAMQLIMPHMPFAVLILFFAIASLLLQIFTTYARYAQYLKYLTLSLLSYVVTAFVIHIDWSSALYHTLIPSFTASKEQIILICAILGTTISPYLFFWQPSQEIEERKLHDTELGVKHSHANKTTIHRMRIDVWSGMFFSNLVMFFIILVCGATLATNGITTITTAEEAAAALRPLAGDVAYFLFTFGIVGTGMLAIPILAGSASYALSESFRWRGGLYRPLKDAYAFYGVIIVSMFLGLLLNFVAIDPIQALIYAAVGNGIIAPILLVCIVLISSNKKIMGSHSNHLSITFFGWTTVAIMAFTGIMAIASLLS